MSQFQKAHVDYVEQNASVEAPADYVELRNSVKAHSGSFSHNCTVAMGKY